jgi:TolA-binding protein
MGDLMKLFFIVALLFIGFSLGTAFAQSGPPAQVPPQVTAQDLENQLSEVGCRAERQAASQTIMQLKQQNSDLQKQLNAMKDPPPKSGATKH